MDNDNDLEMLVYDDNLINDMSINDKKKIVELGLFFFLKNIY